MTKEMAKLWLSAIIGIFAVLAIYLFVFMLFGGFFKNISNPEKDSLISAKAVDDINSEDYNAELAEETNLYQLVLSFWWIIPIIIVLILIIIILLFIIKRLKNSSRSFYITQKNKSASNNALYERSFDLIKRSKDAGISEDEIKKIFRETGWKEREINTILLKYKERFEQKKVK